MPDDVKFDIHQHFGTIMGVPGSAPRTDATPKMDCERRLAFMDHYGIVAAAIMPGHSFNGARGLADIIAINDGVHDYGKLSPDRFPALFGTIDPRHGRACLAEVERLHAKGFRGLSWHNRFQGLPIDHPIMFDIVERMDGCGMVGLFHCYANGDFEAPWRLRRLAERFPATKFCALDAMTSPENLEQLFGIVEQCDNVTIDLTSTLLGPQGVLWALERVGPAKLVFGSNHYSMSPLHRIDALDALDEAHLGEAERRAILHDNARGVLGV